MLDARLPQFYSLEDALLRVDADFSAAESHGIACAVLAYNHQYPYAQWSSHVLKGGDTRDYHVQEAGQLLQQLYQATLAQLNSGDMSFELLFPPEQASLDEQAQAVQKWCQGFAYGLALSGLKSLQDLAEDSRDWVQDVVKIGSAGELDVTDEDASEEALLELAEFLRVGVLMMNEEMQPVRGRPDLGQAEHLDNHKQ